MANSLNKLVSMSVIKKKQYSIMSQAKNYEQD